MKKVIKVMFGLDIFPYRKQSSIKYFPFFSVVTYKCYSKSYAMFYIKSKIKKYMYYTNSFKGYE